MLEDTGAALVVVGGIGIASTFAIIKLICLCRIKVDRDKETSALLESGHSGFADAHRHFAAGMRAFAATAVRHVALFSAVTSTAVALAVVPVVGWRSALWHLGFFSIGTLVLTLTGWASAGGAAPVAARVARAAARDYGSGLAAAFRGALAVGLLQAAWGLASLLLLSGLLFPTLRPSPDAAATGLVAAGVGLSAGALLGRLGGGVFRLAVAVGLEVTVKGRERGPEMDPRHPAALANLVGHAAQGITGAALETLAACAEAVAAAAVVGRALPPAYPLLILAVGLQSSVLGAVPPLNPSREETDTALCRHLRFATLLNVVAQLLLAWWVLPDSFTVLFLDGSHHQVRYWLCGATVAIGTVCAHVMGVTAEGFSSSTNAPIRELSETCDSGAASVLLSGIALGYHASLWPTLYVATTVFVSYNLCGLLGPTLAALGSVSLSATGLVLNAYAGAARAAGAFAEVAGAERGTRDHLDALCAAGHLPMAACKGRSLASAALVLASLCGAFVVRCQPQSKAFVINLLDSQTFFGLVVGAMLPFWIQGLAMSRASAASLATAKEVQRQLRLLEFGRATADPAKCIQVAAAAALRSMQLPCAAVLLAPLTVGLLAGRAALAGLLPGAAVVGLQLALTAGYSGGAWDSARRYVEGGGLGAKRARGSKEHAAAIIGASVGDPLQGVYGPAALAAVKLMAMVGVLCGPLFAPTGVAFAYVAPH